MNKCVSDSAIARRGNACGDNSSGAVPLPLQEPYRLLTERTDELGRRFSDEWLDDDQTSPVVVRRRPILAHGFVPVDENVYKGLHDKLLAMGLFAGRQDDSSLPAR